ncbi:efflux RND transporter periplasmic adaptor subunit [Pseudomonas aeruginosa]|uniref:efflux RND transporter periplasmic adaptor subunit n=1 Tax=Pseudomonas aeruginosa TaxID=287 RepID=UPI002A6B8E1D|nr:efflux RND transporter periplasmic adaptor subunit [Pseudomonas aeruginosa]MDY1227099.1 efflux RND transporter periplasmic adaptor subunit [Pseudomonas aeruginosa]
MRLKVLTRPGCVILSFALLAACGGQDDTAKHPAPAAKQTHPLALSADEIRNAGISVEVVQAQRQSETLRLTGTIVPDQTRIAKILPMLSGRIVSVRVSQGDPVDSGQSLAVLESADLGEARAAFRQAKSEASLADAALDRAQQLTVDDIIPKKDFLRAKADAERAHAALDAAAAKLRLFHVSPENDGERAKDPIYPLVAPFSGTIIDQKAVRGELAQLDQSLFTLADLRTVWVEADVFEKDLSAIATGMPARITVAAYPDREFEGAVQYLGDTMDITTRTIKARIAVRNPERKLKAGMFATVMLDAGSATEALIVPEQAVSMIQGQSAVFVEDGQGFDVRVVETEAMGGGRVRIKTGLSAGERIAVSGIYELKARLLKSQIGGDD